MNVMFCDACQIPCNGPKQWTEHLASKGHAKKSGRASIPASPEPMQWTPVTCGTPEMKKLKISKDPFICTACPNLRFETGQAMRKHLLSVEHARNKMALSTSSSPTKSPVSNSPRHLSPIPLKSVIDASPASPQITPPRAGPLRFSSFSPVLSSTLLTPSLLSNNSASSLSRDLNFSASLTSTCGAMNHVYPDGHSPMCGYCYVDEFRNFHVSEKVHNLSSHFYFVLKDEEIPNIGM